MILRPVFIIALIYLTFPGLYAQEASPLNTLELKDLSSFRQQDGNWMIVGDVVIDPSRDIHDKILVEGPGKKNKKDQTAQQKTVQPVIFSQGQGILLNMNDEKRRSHLLTVMEHGDMELELELMVPKGSNSGIYLQGRYEVQILDSWGVRKPAYSDLGGIYRNWETKPGEIYMGKAPLSNAAKAPGLWQKMRIIFQAPRFNSSGEKISNARFITVQLNGVTIHDHLEVPLPTGGPIDKSEAAFGPLMIQGDHGPVAFRNIRFRNLREVKPMIGAVSYDVFHGNFKTFNDFVTLKPAYSGVSDDLTCEVIDLEDSYAISYKGELTLPEQGDYTFTVSTTGGARLLIDEKIIIDKPGADRWDIYQISERLAAGKHSFQILNYKDAGWMPPRLSFSCRIADGKDVNLHAINSYPPDPNPVSTIFVNPTSETRLLRAFLDFNGNRKQRLTHTIAVGDPSGINYIYDLGSGNLSCVWRGDFIDATPMWHDRGDGSFRPVGAAQYTFLGQPLAYLDDSEMPFPVNSSGDYVSKGYEVDSKSGRPTFQFIYRGNEVSSQILPDETNTYLIQEIKFKEGVNTSGLYYKLGEGINIREIANGSYAIDDQRYYIKVIKGGKPVIRINGDKKELVLAVTASEISWSVIW